MKFGRMLVALLGAAAVLVAPATTAQASTAQATAQTISQAAGRCAPAEEDRWLGTYRGPHHLREGGEFGVLDVTLYREGDAFRILQGTWSTAARINADGLLIAGDIFHGVQVDSANCDRNGVVTKFSGVWWRNVDPHCPCAIGGPFEVTRK